MEPKPRRLSAEDWLLAGFRALAKDGPSALRAEKLARDLGATKGSFYWHFKDIADFRARLLAHWQEQAYASVVAMVEAEGSATEKLYRLADIAGTEKTRYGGSALEPAVRAWAQADHTVSDVLRAVDARRLAYTAGLLAELGLTNPDFARIVYGAYIGMGTLSVADGVDNRGALTSLMAAMIALQEA